MYCASELAMHVVLSGCACGYVNVPSECSHLTIQVHLHHNVYLSINHRCNVHKVLPGTRLVCDGGQQCAKRNPLDCN